MDVFLCYPCIYEKGKESHLSPKKGMLRVADRIKKWGTMATGMLDRSKGGCFPRRGNSPREARY